MIDEVAASLPIWIFLSIVLGFMMGEAVGDSHRHRKCLEQANEDLRDQLQNAQPSTPTLQRALDQQRRVINDIHKRVVAVSKGLEKPAP
jgi:uncharacterized protein YlxW (UPF0749 family)